MICQFCQRDVDLNFQKDICPHDLREGVGVVTGLVKQSAKTEPEDRFAVDLVRLSDLFYLLAKTEAAALLTLEGTATKEMELAFKVGEDAYRRCAKMVEALKEKYA